MSALGSRQTSMSSRAACLQSEFQISQSYVEKPFLEKKKPKPSKQKSKADKVITPWRTREGKVTPLKLAWRSDTWQPSSPECGGGKSKVSRKACLEKREKERKGHAESLQPSHDCWEGKLCYLTKELIVLRLERWLKGSEQLLLL